MLERIKGDYITRYWPHPQVRRIVWSYAHSYWKPRLYNCDPVSCPIKQGRHRHFTWFMWIRAWARLLFRGYTEYRWD